MSQWGREGSEASLPIFVRASWTRMREPSLNLAAIGGRWEDPSGTAREFDLCAFYLRGSVV